MTATTKQATKSGRINRQKGFSLIELLIVVAIIMILAALGIPNFYSARARANEASAVGSVRQLINAQNLYHNSYGNYADGDVMGEEFITDRNLVLGAKSGYRFETLQGTDPKFEFTINAEPVVFVGASATGARWYHSDQTGSIRFSLVDSNAYDSWPVIP